ncbi:MAG: metal ABC transporter permease [Desulfobulbaceae bacterium]|nr:metal ABC transporter permease [Desulfobulbaceae bacterium]
MSFGLLELKIILPAFFAGILVLSTHVPFGREVVKRGIIFIDLAIAQIAGLGVIAAHSFGWETDGWKVQAAAMSASLLGAILLNWTDKRWPEMQEALIGILFVLAASSGILLLANNPHGGEHLKELLVGQILWVNFSDLLPVSLLYAVVLGIWFQARQKLGRSGFYLFFAVIITASVQLVGVYLVFASLIVPAIATVKMGKKESLTWGYGIGVCGYFIGLVLSSLFDLPSGALIVLALTLISIIIFSVTPKSRNIDGLKVETG